MSDQSFEQMLEESIKTIHTGEIVKGTVIGVKEDQIILNIGYKSDGIITRQEYTNNNSLDLRTEAISVWKKLSTTTRSLPRRWSRSSTAV